MIRFLLCTTILPFVMGLTCYRLKKEKETINPAEIYLMGLLWLFLLGEIVSCAVIKLEGSFSLYCRLLGAAVGGWSSFSLVWNWKLLRAWSKKPSGELGERTGWQLENKEEKSRQRAELVLLLVLIGLQLLGHVLYVPDVGKDTTVETVLVTTATDTVFQYNPVTGQPLSYGMYPLYKLAGLPLLYGALQRLCGLSVQRLLYQAIPVWLLLAEQLLLAGWSRLLFVRQKEMRRLFLVLMNLLIVFGDGKRGSFANGLLHGGWKGEVLCAALIVPFGLYMLYQMWLKKEWFYGILGGALALAGVLFTTPLRLPEAASVFDGGTEKQWGVLLLSLLVLYMIREKIKRKWTVQETVLLAFCLFAGLLPGSSLPALGCVYTGVCIWSIGEEWKRGTQVLLCLLLFFCLAGTVFPFQSETVKKWHVPEYDIAIQDKIAQLAESYEGEVYLLAPESVMEQAHINSARILLPYGKDLWYEGCNLEIADVYTEEELTLHEQMKTDYKQPDTIAAMADQMQCRILVLREAMSEEARSRYGYKEYPDVSGYALYYK